MRIVSSQASCGVKEIVDVGNFGGEGLLSETFDRNLKKYIRDEFDRRGSISTGGGTRDPKARIGFMFSDRTDGRAPGRGGAGLAAHILEKRLGRLIESEEFTNYNTGHRIKFWFFYPKLNYIAAARRG